MLRKLTVLAGFCALLLGLCATSAEAQVQVRSQTFYFNGMCTGTDQSFDKSFTPTVTGTVIGADIVVFQTPAGGINYAFAGIAASTNIIDWAGPGQSHSTDFPGFSGFVNAGNNFLGFGFPVVATSQISFVLSCSNLGAPWQSFVTVWFVM